MTVTLGHHHLTTRACYNRGMKFRAGLVIGFGIGYYLGAKAGRERYDQIEDVLDRVRGNPGYHKARRSLEDLYEQGLLRTRGLLDDATGGAAGTLLDLRAGDADDARLYDLDDEPTA